MLFEIDQSVADLFVSDSASAQDVVGLGYLALAAIEGNHRLHGSRSVLSALANVSAVGFRERQVYARAAARVAQDSDLSKRLRVIGKVVGGVGSPSSATNGNRRIITIPLCWFDSSAKIQPTTILGENLDDVDVASIIGRVGTALSNIGFLPMNHLGDMGGGSTIHAVLLLLATVDRLCVCLVDSDKASPLSAMGGTAARLIPFKNETSYPFIEVLETQGRDLENSLPDSFYKARYGNHAKYRALSDVLTNLTNAGEVDIRFHIDVEKGFTLYDLYHSPLESPERIFWEEKLSALMTAAEPQNPLVCQTLGECPHERRADCICEVVCGISRHILREYADIFRASNEHLIAQGLDPSVKSEWTRLGPTIAAWCCAEQKLRI